MKNFSFDKQERGFIGIIIMLVAVGLISGGFYFYLQKQISVTPRITENTVEEVTAKPVLTPTPTPAPTPKPTPTSTPTPTPPPQNINDIIIIEEENAETILFPPPGGGTRWSIIALNFLKQFYQTHGDDYDFIVLFPTKPMDNHNSVRITVDTKGIGVEKQGFPDSRYANYTKKLKSIAELNYHYVWEDPWFPKQQAEVDETLIQTMMHEIAHHWCCFISGWPGKGDYTGATQGIHWPSNLDLFYGDTKYIDVMGYGQWIRNNGKDTCVGQSPTTQWKFSKLTQYLIGLIPQNEVTPISLYEPAEDPNRPVCGKYQTINAYTMAIENIIESNGARIPSYADSQKNLRVAFVVLTPKGESAEQGFVDYIKLYKQALPSAWEEATGGKSHIIF